MRKAITVAACMTILLAGCGKVDSSKLPDKEKEYQVTSLVAPKTVTHRQYTKMILADPKDFSDTICVRAPEEYFDKNIKVTQTVRLNPKKLADNKEAVYELCHY